MSRLNARVLAITLLPISFSSALLALGEGTKGNMFLIGSLSGTAVFSLYLMHRNELMEPLGGIEDNRIRLTLKFSLLILCFFVAGTSFLLLLSSTSLAGQDLQDTSYALLGPPPSRSVGSIHSLFLGSLAFLLASWYFSSGRIDEGDVELQSRAHVFSSRLEAGVATPLNSPLFTASERMFQSLLADVAKNNVASSPTLIIDLLSKKTFHPQMGETPQDQNTFNSFAAELLKLAFLETTTATAYEEPNKDELRTLLSHRKDLTHLVEQEVNRAWLDLVKLVSENSPLQQKGPFRRVLKNLFHLEGTRVPDSLVYNKENPAQSASAFLAMAVIRGETPQGSGWYRAENRVMSIARGLLDPWLEDINTMLHWKDENKLDSFMSHLSNLLDSSEGEQIRNPAILKFKSAIEALAIERITMDVPDALNDAGNLQENQELTTHLTEYLSAMG